MDRLDAKVEKLAERVDGLETKVDGLDIKVDKLTSRVDGLDAKVENLKSSVEGLDGKVHRLTIMQEDLRDDVKRVADGVAGADVRFDRVERSLDELKGTMNSFIQTQSAINGELSSRDADHERRIVAVEKRLP